ncbi:hypothetical protein K4K61_008768 [Colletotrichum sp. SAR11_59]|uniref:Uncharacterized protein n=1 Tax=Colletotrichum asianum TaxID=702518 RepID=A0A8H3WQP8_9PEZI|nr:hypothetical protein GQ607_000489 [Colletotrichum asianum]KAI8316234.1 hypothetical protein K4K61_008768 [Colletotrichum sp. SAR11_59]
MAATSAIQTPGPEAGGSAGDEKAANWNNKKFRDECESVKSKLVDQRFDPKHFPDPLLPRKTPDVRNNPKTSSPEFERKIDQMLGERRAQIL